jgi:hypothetical protein
MHMNDAPAAAQVSNIIRFRFLFAYLALFLSTVWKHCPTVQTPLITAVSNWKEMQPSHTQITLDHLVGYSSVLNCLNMAKDELEHVGEMKPHFKELVRDLGDKCDFLFSHNDEWVKEEYIDEIRSFVPSGKCLYSRKLINY